MAGPDRRYGAKHAAHLANVAPRTSAWRAYSTPSALRTAQGGREEGAYRLWKKGAKKAK